MAGDVAREGLRARVRAMPWAVRLPAEIPVRVDLARCFLAGDSASANIAHHVAQRWTAAATPPPIRLAGLLLLAAYFGGEDRTESELALEGVAPIVNRRQSDFWWKAFLPEGADRNHPAAHFTGEAGLEPELAEAFPPAMVVVGGLDPLQDCGTPLCCAGRGRRCEWWSSRRLYEQHGICTKQNSTE